MKLKKPHEHTLSDALFKHIPNRLREYKDALYDSLKCKKITRGSHNILRCISWARGDNWRRNSHKSLGKQHK